MKSSAGVISSLPDEPPAGKTLAAIHLASGATPIWLVWAASSPSTVPIVCVAVTVVVVWTSGVRLGGVPPVVVVVEVAAAQVAAILANQRRVVILHAGVDAATVYDALRRSGRPGCARPAARGRSVTPSSTVSGEWLTAYVLAPRCVQAPAMPRLPAARRRHREVDVVEVQEGHIGAAGQCPGGCLLPWTKMALMIVNCVTLPVTWLAACCAVTACITAGWVAFATVSSWWSEPDDCPVRSIGRWIVDPDGAVVRAGRCATTQRGTGASLAAGPAHRLPVRDQLPPGIRGFEVVQQLPFDERRLRQALSALDCGALEILVRGMDVEPTALRRRLALRGELPLTVVITRIGSGAAARGTAFVCRPSR